MTSATVFDDAHAVRCELAAEVLRSSGTLRLRVNGWSMLPAVLPGDTLVVERIDAADVSRGDIVLFGRERRLFAHRVMRRGPEIQTRGDAMPDPDPPVPQSDVLGRVAVIERNGKCIAPRRRLRLRERFMASLVQGSELAARVVLHGLLRPQ